MDRTWRLHNDTLAIARYAPMRTSDCIGSPTCRFAPPSEDPSSNVSVSPSVKLVTLPTDPERLFWGYL